MYKKNYVCCCKKPFYYKPVNILVFMKAIFLLTVAFVQLAMASHGQNVNIQVKNTPVANVLYQLSLQSGYDFIYDAGLLTDLSPITLDAKNQPLEDVLEQCFADQPVELIFKEDKTVVISLRKTTAEAATDETADIVQDQVVGTVKDASGMPLQGVSVLVRGTSRGTATDAAGQFQIDASIGETLIFRNIGFVSHEIEIGNQRNLEVVLTEETADLEEVVVVGYGSQQKTDVTGSITSVNMSNVEGQSIASLDQGLSGQVAGVNVSTSNGAPGGGPRIQVRGIGAIGATSDPLYVIDGFPVPSSSGQMDNPMSSINPDDIESMTILKDASATAIYGSRGANGVVMITTKRGASGKPKIQLSLSSGLQQVPQKGRPDLMNGQEFAQFMKESTEDRIRSEEGREPTIDDIPEIYRNPEAIGAGTDWYDAVTRVAPMTNVGLSISGGNDNIRTFTSAGYFQQSGVMTNTKFERFSLRTNVDAQVTERFRVGLNLSPSMTFSRGSIRGQGRDEFFEIANPIPPVYNEDGSYNDYIQTPGTFGNPNPLKALRQTVNNAQRTKIIASTFGEYEIIDNLKFRSSFNVDFENRNSENFRPSTIGAQNAPPPSVPTGNYGSRRYLNWLNENTLTYDYLSASGHSISAVAGYTIQQNKVYSNRFDGQQFPDDDIESLNAAARVVVGNMDISDWVLISYLARANYSYAGKYMLTATIRSDGSSRFGPENRWGTFPSFALGWRVSEENFLKNSSWVNELKLRASYGMTGNFNIGDYPYMSNIGTRDYVFNGTLGSGRVMTTLGNPILGWERMRELNVGIDFNFLNNRINLTADFYNRNTEDLLLNVEIPQSSGFETVTENRGDVRNRGLELGILSKNIVSDNFDWSTNFNLSFNRNKVIALGRSDDPIYSGNSSEGNPTNITRIGEPVGMIIGYVYEGIYQNEADLQNYPAFPGAIPGNMRFRDVNGDGEVTPFTDFDVIGNPYPDFNWGMTNTLRYKSFDLRVMVVGAMGAEMLRATNFYTWNLDGVFNVQRNVMDRWRSPEQPGSGKVPTTMGTGRGRVMFRDTHSLSVEKTDYAWIKNITLGYSLPASALQNSRISNFRVYATLQNAFLFTGYSGNPEGTNYNRPDTGALVPGIDYSNYPVPRIYTLGVNVSF